MKKPQEIKSPYGIMHDDGSLGRLQKVSQKSKEPTKNSMIIQTEHMFFLTHVQLGEDVPLLSQLQPTPGAIFRCTRPVLLKEVNDDPELRRFLERNWLDHDQVCGWKGLRS